MVKSIGWLILLLINLCSFHVTAQDNVSINGRFQVNFTRGCAPFDIEVSDLSGAPVNLYCYFDCEITNPDIQFTSDTDTTYSTPGTYKILQLSTDQQGDPTLDSIFITVIDPNTEPQFSFSVCSNNQIQLTLSNDPVYDAVAIAIPTLGITSDTIRNNQSRIYAFPVSGDETISYTGTFNSGQNNCNTFERTVTLSSDLRAADITGITSPSGGEQTGSVLLEFNLSPNSDYSLQQSAPNRASNFSEIAILNSDNSILVENLNTSDLFYCYRIVTSDQCSGTQDLVSDTVCSVALRVDSLENENLITWNTIRTQNRSSRLTKNGSEILSENEPVTFSLIDNDIRCNEENCYQVSFEKTDGLVATSAVVCKTVRTNIPPPGLNDITPSIVDNAVVIDWSLNDIRDTSTFRIERSVNQDDFDFRDSTRAFNYQDLETDPNTNRYRYSITYKDACGNVSEPGTISQPVLLRLNETNLNSFEIVWNDLRGWALGIQNYNVQELDDAMAVVNTTDVGLQTTFVREIANSEQQRFFFQIEATPGRTELGPAFSNILEVYVPAQLIIPTAIYPDSNREENRRLEVAGVFLDTFELFVFNRWGELVFYSNAEDEAWDGTNTKGDPAPVGMYVYNINFSDFNGVNYSESGSVLLIR
jgi:hypothetical protein